VGIAHKICWWAVPATIDFQTTHTKRSSDQRFNRLCEHAITHHLNTNEAIYTIKRNKYAMKDPIIAEIRRVRETYAEKFNYDVYAMLHDLKERQTKSGRKVVLLPPKRLKPVEQTTYATTMANT